LNTTPAMVVPVFQADGGGMPLRSSSALRLHSSKLKPPPLDPMAPIGPPGVPVLVRERPAGARGRYARLEDLGEAGQLGSRAAPLRRYRE
jgi:hypothetical protein